MISIYIKRQVAVEAEVLVYDPGGLAKLMQVTSRLAVTDQEVAELLKAVVKEVTPEKVMTMGSSRSVGCSGG